MTTGRINQVASVKSWKSPTDDDERTTIEEDLPNEFARRWFNLFVVALIKTSFTHQPRRQPLTTTHYAPPGKRERERERVRGAGGKVS